MANLTYIGKNLIAVNWWKAEYGGLTGTRLYDANGNPRVNMLQRAARLRIYPWMLNEANEEYVYENINPEFEDPDSILIWNDSTISGMYTWGDWRIDRSRINISGYGGVTSDTWLIPDAYPYQIHPSNPLKDTEYETDFDTLPGHNHPYMPFTPYNPTYGFSGTYNYGDDECSENQGALCQSYTYWTEENTKQYGHQDIQAYVNSGGSIDDLYVSPDGGCDNDQILSSYEYLTTEGDYQGYPCIWTNTQTMIKYVDPAHTAEALWNENVKKIVAFDSIGTGQYQYINSIGNIAGPSTIGHHGNEIDMFVLLKDEWDDLTYNDSLAVDNEYPYGVFISGMSTDNESGLSYYEEGGRIIRVDIDGFARFVPHTAHPPTWDPLVTNMMPGTPYVPPPPTTNRVEVTYGGNEIDLNGDEVPVLDESVDIIVASRRPKWKMFNKPPSPEETDYIDINKNRIHIHGKAVPNQPYTIATVKASVGYTEDSDGKKSIAKYISKAPYLVSNNDNIELKVVKKEKINSKVSCYYLDLIFTPPRYNSLKAFPTVDIRVDVKDFPTYISRDKAITRLNPYSCDIKESGELKKIIINGVKDSDFTVLINESELDIDIFNNTDDYDGGDVNRIITHNNDTSIISPGTATGTTDWFSDKLRCISSKIPSSGSYVINQQFPSNTVKLVKVNESAGTRSVVILDSVKDLKIGDYMYPLIASGQNYKEKVAQITAINESTKTITLNNTVHTSNIPDNSSLEFKRDRVYTANLLPELSSNITCAHRTVYTQRNKPDITIRHTPPAECAITHNRGVATGLAKNVNFNYIVNDYKTARGKTIVKFELLLDLHTGSQRFTAFKNIHQFQIDQYFSNYLATQNGGTELAISAIKSSPLNVNDTITFSYQLEVLKWGKRDFTLSLNLGDLYTIT